MPLYFRKGAQARPGGRVCRVATMAEGDPDSLLEVATTPFPCLLRRHCPLETHTAGARSRRWSWNRVGAASTPVWARVSAAWGLEVSDLLLCTPKPSHRMFLAATARSGERLLQPIPTCGVPAGGRRPRHCQHDGQPQPGIWPCACSYRAAACPRSRLDRVMRNPGRDRRSNTADLRADSTLPGPPTRSETLRWPCQSS